MGAAAEITVEAELVTGTWTDLTPDTHAASGLRLRYGVGGNQPLDMVAGTGECGVTLQNHAGNSGSQQGYYSPLHGSVRSGWTVGVPFRVIFHRTADVAASVSSITRSGSTATATTASAHGLASNDWVTIAGADQTEYNGTVQVTVTGGSTFTYTVSGTPASPATGTLTWRRAYVKHRGRVWAVDPQPGQYLEQLVDVTSYDGMRDLAEADLREVALQIDKGEDELVTALLDALPSDAQPVARSVDAGVDTYPYAFDDLGPGTKALAAIKDVAVSAFALATMKGDGTFRWQSRHTRATGASAHTFTDSTIHGLSVPADVAKLRNRVRVTIQPRTVDAAATTVVYSTVGTPLSVSAGDTITVWVEYRDPDETRTLIGARDVVTTLVSGTDYEGNAAEDGTGADLSSDLSITVTAFASTAKIEIENTGASTVYLVSDGAGGGPAQGEPFLQIRGKGVYNLGPQTFEASSASAFTRALNVELRYQNLTGVAQAYADYLHSQYSSLIAQLSMVEFIANDSADLLEQALAREPGDVITLSETVTGVSSLEAVIHSVELEVTPGPWIRCRWGLAPAAPFRAWLFGVAGRSEFGVTTKIGF